MNRRTKIFLLLAVSIASAVPIAGGGWWFGRRRRGCHRHHDCDGDHAVSAFGNIFGGVMAAAILSKSARTDEIIDAINKTTGKLNKVEGRPTPNGRTLPFRVNKEGGFVISRHTAKNKYKNMAFLTGQSKRNDILFLTNIFFMVNV